MRTWNALIPDYRTHASSTVKRRKNDVVELNVPRTRRFPAVFPIALVGLIAFAVGLAAQTGETNTKETAVTFKSGVSLVPVPVVVRDGKGKTVSTLGIEDFQLFDNGKPQMISKFTVEK